MAEKTNQTYDKAIIVGASTIGKELATLRHMLKEVDAKNHITDDAEDEKKNKNPKDTLIIAADNGIQMLATCDVKPDYWVGDMDSLQKDVMPEWLDGILCDKLPVEKDDTDMAVAVSYAYEKGCREIQIFGAVGGRRPSHTMANIQLAYAYAMKDCHVVLFGDGYEMEVVMNQKQFGKNQTGNISVFALTDVAKDVSIKGLKYEYEGDLFNQTALGVSNCFIGKESEILVKQGALLIVTEEES